MLLFLLATLLHWAEAGSSSRLAALSTQEGTVWLSGGAWACGHQSLVLEGRPEGPREVELLLPCQAAGAAGNPRPTAASGPEPMPLLLALHCFGCDTDSEWNKHAAAAADDGIVLVVPRGLQRSWNAGACCGYAREKNVLDTDFLLQLILMLTHALGGGSGGGGLLGRASAAVTGPTVATGDALADGEVSVSAKAVYVTGFSNGGFLASALLQAQIELLVPPRTVVSVLGSEVFRGLIPMAGYDYTAFAGLRASNARAAADVQHAVFKSFASAPKPAPTTPTAFLLLWASDDTKVAPAGCCGGQEGGNAGGEPCCCGISSESCVSDRDIFNQHLVKNGCQVEAREVGLVQASAPPAHCLVGIGCQVPTAYCRYSAGGHTLFVAGRGWGNLASTFVRASACALHGSWDCAGGRTGEESAQCRASSKSGLLPHGCACSCKCDSGFSGNLCMVPLLRPTLPTPAGPATQAASPGEPFGAASPPLLLLLALFIALLLLWLAVRNYRRVR